MAHNKRFRLDRSAVEKSLHALELHHDTPIAVQCESESSDQGPPGVWLWTAPKPYDNRQSKCIGWGRTLEDAALHALGKLSEAEIFAIVGDVGKAALS